MPDVRVNAMFRFIERPDKTFVKPENVGGEGQIELTIDKLPETPEEWKYLSKVIGENGDYAAVEIQGLVQLDANQPEENEVIQGEIVDD